MFSSASSTEAPRKMTACFLLQCVALSVKYTALVQHVLLHTTGSSLDAADRKSFGYSRSIVQGTNKVEINVE